MLHLHVLMRMLAVDDCHGVVSVLLDKCMPILSKACLDLSPSRYSHAGNATRTHHQDECMPYEYGDVGIQQIQDGALAESGLAAQDSRCSVA